MTTNTLYRPDIDGLRAIAVLSVIICHANANWLPGGFIGVDVFFVISGYLITSIIYSDIQKQGFSYSDFYTRRIKRLMPVFFTVLFSTLAIAIYMFTANDLENLGKSARHAAFFASNFYFSAEQDYFSPNTYEMPLLHTWSLAVEEQFYLLWPIILLTVLRFAPRLLLATSLLLCVASLVLGSVLALNPETSSWNFYHLPARMGELLIGALLALYKPRARFAQVIAIIGLLLIVVPMVLLNKQSTFPGYNALWPCLGTALVIWAGNQSALPWINRLLSFKPVVFIGLLSYSLYLWHWPILTFARYYTASFTLSHSLIAICLLLSLVLAYLSWRFIEQPTRKQKLSFKSCAMRYLLIPLLLLLMISVAIKKTEGYLWRSDKKPFEEVILNDLGCVYKIRRDCSIGDQDAEKTTLIYGDSHGKHFSLVLDTLAKQQHWRADFYSANSCSFLTKTNTLELGKTRICSDFTQHINNTITHYRNVVMIGRWQRFLATDNPNREVFIEEFTQRISELRAHNIQVLIVNQAPEYEKDVLKFKHTGKDNLLVDLSATRAFLTLLATEFEHVAIIDFSPILLQWKNGLLNGLPTYMDSHHLNHFGQQQLAKEIIASGNYDWIGEKINAQLEPRRQDNQDL